MEFVQDLLTYATEIAALTGFAGIALHAILSQHRRFMSTYCPPVAPYTPDTQEVKPTAYKYACPLSCEWVAPQPKPQAKVKQPKRQLVSVGAAAIDYDAMSVPQRRNGALLISRSGDSQYPPKKWLAAAITPISRPN